MEAREEYITSCGLNKGKAYILSRKPLTRKNIFVKRQ